MSALEAAASRLSAFPLLDVLALNSFREEPGRPFNVIYRLMGAIGPINSRGGDMGSKDTAPAHSTGRQIDGNGRRVISV